MFAWIAVFCFGLALILDWADAHVGDALTNTTLITAGLLCLALHTVGIGAGWGRRG